jgi:NDP-sugar pyrophosphorylase family protein
MKTILICPNQAHGLTVLADIKPIPTLPILGEPFICYWMDHLAAQKFKEVRIVTSDPAEVITEYVGDGSRWGLKVEVFHEVRDLGAEEARKRYKPAYEKDWAPEPLDVTEANHLPGLPEEKPFTSYADWFQILPRWLPIIAQSKRIGMREISPGVWVGRRTKISKEARLTGPCWIGDHVQIGKSGIIGPNSFLEDQVVVDVSASIENSWVGPETFLGALAELKDSLAWGSTLVNWKTGSHTVVPDPFLLSSLSDRRERDEAPVRQPTEIAQPGLARRLGSVFSFAKNLQS